MTAVCRFFYTHEVNELCLCCTISPRAPFPASERMSVLLREDQMELGHAGRKNVTLTHTYSNVVVGDENARLSSSTQH